MAKDHTQIEVLELPPCDIPGCKEVARYDGKTSHGPWANMCEEHFDSLGVGLGLGKGQKLIIKGGEEEMAKDDKEKKTAEKGKEKAAAPYKVKIVFEFIETVNGLDIKELETRANSVLEKFKPKSKEVKLESSKCIVEKIAE